MRRVLVIKLGALGDFVLAFGPFAAIRAAHPGAEITLLTTPPFAELARASPWFDRVVEDRRAPPWDVPVLLRLRRALRGFDMVYDLQTSARSGWYYRLAGRPAWSGIAPGCSHPHDNPGRNAMHTVERQREQLARAGIQRFAAPSLDWLGDKPSLCGRGLGGTGKGSAGGSPWKASVGEGRSGTNLRSPCAPHPDPLPQGEGKKNGAGNAILIPGAAAHRPRKRWPAARFGELADVLHACGLSPVIVGAATDAPHAAAILALCPAAIDLTGRTSLLQLAGVMAGATVAIGNDTGPTHLAAALGLPTIALFSADSDPALTRPRGNVTVLAVADLADLSTERVAAALPPVHAHSPATLEAL